MHYLFLFFMSYLVLTKFVTWAWIMSSIFLWPFNLNGVQFERIKMKSSVLLTTEAGKGEEEEHDDK